MNEDVVEKIRLLEDIVESIPGGIFQFHVRDDGAMWFRYRSKRAYELAHLPPDWALGINSHPDDRDRLVETVHEAVRALGPVSYEGRCFVRSGDIRWMQVQAVTTKSGDEVILNGIVLDVTDRKHAEESERESKERFENAFEYAAIGMALVSTDGHWLRVNHAICEMLGYSESELLEKTFQEITHPDDLDADLGYVHEMLAGEISTCQMEKRYFHKSGKVIWVVLSVSMERDDLGNPRQFISQVQDITDRKQADQEKQHFYRETIRCATQGKLDLVSIAEVQQYIDDAALIIDISSNADTVHARLSISEFCKSKGFGNDRLGLFELAAGEAMTNAIKHSGEGLVYAGTSAGVIWVAVSDKGTGISALTLPGVTLRRGFSTKISMGMGYSIMLEASDSILLNTGSNGTTVVLLKNIDAPKPVPSLDELPDTWD